MTVFVLGTNQILAEWELHALLPTVAFSKYLLGLTASALNLDDQAAQQLQKRLGGTREILWLHDQIFTSWEEIKEGLAPWITEQSGREITLIADHLSLKERTDALKEMKELYSRPVRFRIDKRYLANEGGTVFWLIQESPGQFRFGRSLSQQDIEEYSDRDYGKPSRSMRRGMLPPKLAQIMLNGAKPNESDVIWDPFCGTGTVNIEAVLMGFKTLASDRDSSAIAETKENVQSLLSNEQQAFVLNIWQQDITQPWSELSMPATMIVGEGYLGEPQTNKMDTPSELRFFWQKVEPLYQKLFQRLNNSTIRRVVLATPVLATNQGLSRLAKRTWNILALANWQVEFQTDYMRPNQIVGREITCLVRN